MGTANLIALLACGLAMGLGALGSGWGLGYTAQAALRATARQPARAAETFRNMLVGQAITETPAIFSLVVAFLLYFASERALDEPDSPAQAARFLAAALCIGIGSLGAGVGSGLVAHEAIEGISRRPSGQGPVMLLMLIGQAWAQTGGIFALVVSLFLLNSGGGAGAVAAGAADIRLWGSIPINGAELASAARCLGAGIAMGVGAIGSSLGIAYAGSVAAAATSDRPDAAGAVKTVYFIGAATAQSPSVFSLIIALILVMGA